MWVVLLLNVYFEDYKQCSVGSLYKILDMIVLIEFCCNILQAAIKMVQPSSKREGFSTIPNVKWEDVGGLDLLREEFDRYIVRRIKYPELCEVNFYGLYYD